MDDLQKLKTLLDDFGIEYAEQGVDSTGGHCITCSEGDEGVKGYHCFYTIFDFDSGGNFIEMGVYE